MARYQAPIIVATMRAGVYFSLVTIALAELPRKVSRSIMIVMSVFTYDVFSGC